MSKLRPIKDLSKAELLSLIYHNLPRTLYEDHPCECGACGEDPIGITEVVIGLQKRTVQTHGFVCDECNMADAPDDVCMCGDPIEGHGFGAGHGPVSMRDHYNATRPPTEAELKEEIELLKAKVIELAEYEWKYKELCK